jgi:hypothetical protein
MEPERNAESAGEPPENRGDEECAPTEGEDSQNGNQMNRRDEPEIEPIDLSIRCSFEHFSIPLI